MKKGWQSRKLGDLCVVDWGNTDLTKSAYVEGGKFLAVSAAGCDGRIGHSEHVKHTPVLSAIGAQCGRMFLPDEDFTAIKNTITLTPRAGTCTGQFLYQLLTYVDLPKRGAAQPFISKGDIQTFQVTVPESLAEQQRIVGILDEAFEGIATAKANAEKNLENARALFESHLQSVFTQRGEGWAESKLKSITTKIGSGATPRGGEESYKAEGISLIRSLNVHDLAFKYAKLAFLDDAQADELSNVEVQPRDVLLNITGASVARCTIVPDDVLPARVNQHVSIIRPIAGKLDAAFLHYTLISKPYKDALLKTGEEGGSTRQAITKAQIQEFSVEYPATLGEQKTIVAKLDAMLAETQRLATIYERKLAALDNLKKSLLHQAFSGNL
jgi:type I restriction enzyme S subunit